MADIFDTIESAMRTLQERLSVSTTYGEPVTANGVTIVPVSKVRFGFGGGGGSGGGSTPGVGGEEGQSGSGSRSGMGGGGQVEPVGFIEITDAGARWVPLEPPRSELALNALTALLAVLPVGGRGAGAVLRRLMLVGAAQALLGGLVRRRMQLPGGLLGRRALQEPT
jgi:uncharacterized spore protein YtfJ